MFTHNKFENYNFEDIPLNQDLYIMDEVYINDYELSFINFFNGDDFETVGQVGFVVARKIHDNSIELSLYANSFERFHEVSILLHKKDFIHCVSCYECDEKPHIFVKSDWLKNIYTNYFSVFAIIDAINVKKALENATLTRAKLINLRNEIDKLSIKYPQVSFISFADNILLKSNWSIGYYNSDTSYNYHPEVFIELASKINEIYEETLNLSTYTIIAQGTNEYYSDDLLHISKSKNHVCLNSLGTPFAQIKDIETSARQAIKNKIHKPAEIYLDEQYYNSLKFKYEFNKKNTLSNSYTTKMISKPCKYFYTSISNLLENLDKNLKLEVS